MGHMDSNCEHNFRSNGTTSEQNSDQMKLVADCLESIRQTVPSKNSISFETFEELEEYLALAEAALRRASAEISIKARYS